MVDKYPSAMFTAQFTDVAQVGFELTESKHEREENSDSEGVSGSPTTKNRERNERRESNLNQL